jgi:hypothetical protein
MRSKNNTFRQVVSTEKSTFAHSEKWLNQGSEPEVSRYLSGAIPLKFHEAKKAGTKQTFSNT